MAKMKTLTVSGQTYTVWDPEAVRSIDGQKPDAEGNIRVTDDTRAGAAAWSGKHIADSLCRPFAEYGALVTCRPVAGYPLQAHWENKNLVPFNESFTFTGVLTKQFTTPLPAGRYTWSCGGYESGGSSYPNFVVFDENGTAIPGCGFMANQGSLAIYPTKPIYGVYLYSNGWAVESREVTSAVARLQLEKGTTATAYEPYSDGTSVTLTRRGKNICPYATSDQTNDSGHINFYSGARLYSGKTLTVSADITRADTTLTENGTMRFYFYYTDGTRTTKTTTYGAERDGLPHKKAITMTAEAGKIIDYMRIIPVDNTVDGDRADNIQLELGNTATDFEPYNSGTFAPGDAIPALPGINALYANSGLVTVTGRKDPVAEMEKLKNAILALGGNV